MIGNQRLIYAVGDVHGHADKLMAIHDAISRDFRGQAAERALLIHLGDYIDRGPDSSGCLAMLAAGRAVGGLATINLMGNHEAMLLDALDRRSTDAVGLWLDNGGEMTLESWGIHPAMPVGRWEEAIPVAQIAFLRGLAVHHAAGSYVFVHAGVRPGLPLAQQRRTDLLWIREGFLDWNGTFLPEAPDAVIVHGHTPTLDPVVARNRIGIDTGAGAGRALTCAVLGAGPPRFLQA